MESKFSNDHHILEIAHVSCQCASNYSSQQTCPKGTDNNYQTENFNQTTAQQQQLIELNPSQSSSGYLNSTGIIHSKDAIVGSEADSPISNSQLEEVLTEVKSPLMNRSAFTRGPSNVLSQKKLNKSISVSDQQFMNGTSEEDDVAICELLAKAQDEKEANQYEEAEQTYFKVLEAQKQKYGKTSIQLASTYKKLASMFQKNKTLDQSLMYYQEALQIFTSEGDKGVHCSREATCLISISNIYLQKEDLSAAQEYVAKAIHIYNTLTLEDEQMKPLLISQALRLKRKIDVHEKQKSFEEKQIAVCQEETTCSICLDDIQENKRVRKLTCGHIFHIKCIAEWLSQNPKCPYCREVMPKPN